MHQKSVEQGEIVEFNLELQKAIANIGFTNDLGGACVEFARFLKRIDVQLLSVKFCDVGDRAKILRPYTAYHQAMQQFRTGPGYPDGCPFSREAMKRLRPFSLESIDRSQYTGLNDRRFFKELEKTGHSNIAIVPVMIGRGLSLITIGLGGSSFAGAVRSLVTDACSHFVAAFVARYPDVSKLFEKKVLNQSQRETVLLACEGLCDEEIGRRLELSSVAVQMIFESAAKRLGTSNRAATVYRSVILGEIPSGAHLSENIIFHKEVLP
jgi:DNA-binding CsgD family transcriptional regulator